MMAEGTRYEKVVFAVAKTTLLIARNHHEMEGKATKATVHNASNRKPFHHLPL